MRYRGIHVGLDETKGLFVIGGIKKKFKTFQEAKQAIDLFYKKAKPYQALRVTGFDAPDIITIYGVFGNNLVIETEYNGEPFGIDTTFGSEPVFYKVNPESLKIVDEYQKIRQAQRENDKKLSVLKHSFEELNWRK